MVSSARVEARLVKPFRALRYDTATAGPLDDLVAPPYDVISPASRALVARTRTTSSG